MTRYSCNGICLHAYEIGLSGSQIAIPHPDCDEHGGTHMKFTVTEDHIKLLQHMYVGWSDAEFGAPEVDPKRPYGNSDVIGDVAEILGWKVPDADYSEQAYQSACELAETTHRETLTALQIALVTGSFTPGEYIKTSRYDDRSWIKVA